MASWQEPGGSTAGQKWQHAWIIIDPNNRDEHAKLETMGNDGWEMVSAVLWGQGPTASFIMFFKRPKVD